MIQHAQGELLAQVRPGVTTAVELFKAGNLRVEITLILGTAIEGAAATSLALYHDDSGNDVYSDDTIIHTLSKQANDSDLIFQAQHPGSGIMLKAGGSLGVKIGTANNINFSVYGHSEVLADRVRGLSNG